MVFCNFEDALSAESRRPVTPLFFWCKNVEMKEAVAIAFTKEKSVFWPP
jgi:hypothetical protein